MISVLIPTYKERDNIRPLVEQIGKALSGLEYRVLFIDDDSRDGTEELVKELSSNYPVEILVRRDKRGLASAVVDGIRHSTGETVVVMDADLQHPPEVVPGLLKALDGGAEVAIASRYVPGGDCADWGRVRRVISRGAMSLAHLLLPSTRSVCDPMSGFFAFRRPVVEGARLEPTGYKILLEVLVQGRFQRAAEVPYVFGTRSCGVSKLNTRQQIEYLKHLYSLMRRSGERRRFFKFLLVGASGVLVNMGLLWLLTEVGGLFYLYSSAVSIETSIISNFLLNEFFTFRDRRAPGHSMLSRMLKFNLVSLAGLGLNLGTLWLLTSVVGMYYMLSNLVGIAVAAMWNYVLSTGWTWR